MRVLQAPLPAVAVAVAATLSMWAAPAGAQAVADHWRPWLGCWAPVAMAPGAASVCFVATDDPTTVERVSVAEGALPSREQVRADARPRSTVRDGCVGSEAVSVSDDGHRLFTRSSLTCEDGAARTATGIMAMLTPTQWIDVRAVEQDGQRVPAARFYQWAAPEVGLEAGIVPPDAEARDAIQAARAAASTPATSEDVREASRHVDGAAVAAWIVESGSGFDLDGGTLLALDDAGVPDEVIDVMIAVSFPEHFEISRNGEPLDRMAAAGPSKRGGYGGSPASPLYAFPYGYGGFGFYGYAYRPLWLYTGWGYGYPGYRPIFVDVRPASPRTAKVVKGKGYTRGRSAAGTASGSSPRIDGGSRGSPGWKADPGPSRGSSTGRKAKRRGGA